MSNTVTLTGQAKHILSGGFHDYTQGADLRTLDTLLEKIRERVPEVERPSVKIFGIDGLSWTFEHVLTPQEALERDVQELQDSRARIKALLPRAGDGMTPDQVAALRNLLGTGI